MLARWLLATLLSTPAAPDDHQGVISGVIVHRQTKEPIEDAIVIVQCACLPTARETRTNARGFYAFTHLPAGTYTVQVLVGGADVSKVITLPAR